MFDLARSPTRSGSNHFVVGDNRSATNVASHQILSDGYVAIRLPTRPLTDSEARRLAWGILADLAPDEVAPVPQVVTYKEGGRFLILAALSERPRRIDDLAQELGWGRRTVERRLKELVEDGRVQREGVPPETAYGIIKDSPAPQPQHRSTS